MVETLCSGVFLAWVGALALPLTSQVTLGKSLYIFGSQFPHLYNGDNNGTELMGLLYGFNIEYMSSAWLSTWPIVRAEKILSYLNFI